MIGQTQPLLIISTLRWRDDNPFGIGAAEPV